MYNVTNNVVPDTTRVQEETVVTAGVMDLRIADTSNDGNYVPILVLSTPRSLVSTEILFFARPLRPV
jgi:hypothetical protein